MLPLRLRAGTRTLAYPVELTSEDDGTWSVVLPDLPGCVSWAETHDDALLNAAEAATLHLEGLRDHGDQIPEPSNPTYGQETVLVRV